MLKQVSPLVGIHFYFLHNLLSSILCLMLLSLFGRSAADAHTLELFIRTFTLFEEPPLEPLYDDRFVAAAWKCSPSPRLLCLSIDAPKETRSPQWCALFDSLRRIPKRFLNCSSISKESP